MASVFFMVWPAFSARCEEAWIAGPSAMGSEKGMPSSMMSAPAPGRPLSTAREVSWSGSPAVMNATRPARPSRFSSANFLSIRVVTSIRPSGFGAQIAGNGIEVLVAAARDVHHHQVILRLQRRYVEQPRDRVGRLERRDDALELAAQLERGHRLVVGRREEVHPFHVVEPSVLGADARIIEPRRDRMRFLDLAVRSEEH